MISIASSGPCRASRSPGPLEYRALASPRFCVETTFQPRVAGTGSALQQVCRFRSKAWCPQTQSACFVLICPPTWHTSSVNSRLLARFWRPQLAMRSVRPENQRPQTASLCRFFGQWSRTRRPPRGAAAHLALLRARMSPRDRGNPSPPLSMQRGRSLPAFATLPGAWLLPDRPSSCCRSLSRELAVNLQLSQRLQGFGSTRPVARPDQSISSSPFSTPVASLVLPIDCRPGCCPAHKTGSESSARTSSEAAPGGNVPSTDPDSRVAALVDT
jgi:hypothetical protein